MRALFLVLLLTIGVAACDHETVTTETAIVSDCDLDGPRVSPGYASLHAGDTLRLKADFLACGQVEPTYPEFHWSSNDSSIAMVDSISGLVRARKNGLTTITATLVSNVYSKASVAINVVP